MKYIYLALMAFIFVSYDSMAMSQDVANAKSYIHEYAFLSNGFDMKNYQSCKKLIAKNCPAKFAISDCTNVSIVKQPVCSQFEKLSQAIGGQISSVFLKPYGKTMLVSQYYIADGQAEYYIISSSNQVINTNIDPLTLDLTLKQKYQKVSLLPVHWEKPKIQLSPKKDAQIFDFSMKAHDTCLACKVVVAYDLRFNFDESGKFISVQLLNKSLSP